MQSLFQSHLCRFKNYNKIHRNIANLIVNSISIMHESNQGIWVQDLARNYRINILVFMKILFLNLNIFVLLYKFLITNTCRLITVPNWILCHIFFHGLPHSLLNLRFVWRWSRILLPFATGQSVSNDFAMGTEQRQLFILNCNKKCITLLLHKNLIVKIGSQINTNQHSCKVTIGLQTYGIVKRDRNAQSITSQIFTL